MPRRRSFPEHREPLFWGTGRGFLWDQSSLLISADPLSSYIITPVLPGEETGERRGRRRATEQPAQ